MTLLAIYELLELCYHHFKKIIPATQNDESEFNGNFWSESCFTDNKVKICKLKDYIDDVIGISIQSSMKLYRLYTLCVVIPSTVWL